MMTRWWTFGWKILVVVVVLGCNGETGDDDASMESSAGSGGSSDRGSPDREMVCAKTCQTAAMVNCPGDASTDCVAECRKLWDQTTCQSQIHDLVRCGSNAPVSEWECDDMQESNVKAGTCDAALAALSACAQR